MGWRRLTIPRLPRRLVALTLALVILVGGGIDLVPIANDPLQRRLLAGDRLFDWVRDETDPRSVFVSDIHIHHPILLAGRRIYLGWPAYPFSMGYDMATREASYRRLLSSKSPRDVVRELQAEGIDYVAYDDGVRDEDYVQDTNEALYREFFETVFTDEANDYRHLTIYRVPTDPEAWRSMPGADPVEMFTGGLGTDAGRFDGPRGIGVGADGSVLIADTRNHRIQRFSAGGEFLGEFGAPGDGPGRLDEPHGVAADSRGHVFVADSLNDRVLEFDQDGGFVAEWRGTDAGFYGPRDVAIGPDDTLFVLDQGRARVVRRAPDGSTGAFGSFGGGDGQLDDPTGLGVAANVVAVADPTNGRIVVFDRAGRFVRSIPVAEWASGGAGPGGFPDVAVAPDGASILATSPATNEVLVFSVDGDRLQTLGPPASGSLDGPGAIAIGADGAVYVVNLPANRVSLIRP
jgi:DNA-binding beta-propeller fold protein YncE